jgi:hypothetical protein
MQTEKKGTTRYSISMDVQVADRMDALLKQERWDVSGYLERLVVADLKEPRFF